MKKEETFLYKNTGTLRKAVLALLSFVAIALVFSGWLPFCAANNTQKTSFDDNKTVFSRSVANEPLLSSDRTDGNGNEALPEEYEDFIASLPDDTKQKLPDGVWGKDADSVSDAAGDISSVPYLITTLFDAFGSSLSSLFPTFAMLLGIVIIAAVCRAIASNTSAGLSSAVALTSRICTYCTVAIVSLNTLQRLSDYFDSLFAAVASFIPLSGALLAAGGNINGAAQGSVTLSATLAVCQFFFSETAIPVFSVCMSLTMLTAFEEVGDYAGRSISVTIKKWYTTALSFVMMILTVAVTAQNIISAKADGAAMRGMKFAAGSFIPISGGTVSGTLGTLAASVELLRGSVGVMGIAVILLMLLPIIVELAALRGIFALCAFGAGMLGCGFEKGLLDEIGSLYGYLEGIAALSAVVFLVAFALFAASGAAVVS